MDHANPRLCCGFSRGLPCLADFREKTSATGTIFPKNFVSAIPVIADSRGREHNARWFRCFSQRFGQMPSARNSAIENTALLCGSPEAENTLTRQMDDGFESRNRFQIERLSWIPPD